MTEKRINRRKAVGLAATTIWGTFAGGCTREDSPSSPASNRPQRGGEEMSDIAAVPESMRSFYQARVADFRDPHRRINLGPLELIRGPDDCERVPSAVFEACGFYFVNVLEQDNGSVIVFQADIGGRRTYGVLSTTDGSDSHLETYAADGQLLGAAVVDTLAGTIAWQDRNRVRWHSAMWG
jgi:hypothetical protein